MSAPATTGDRARNVATAAADLATMRRIARTCRSAVRADLRDLEGPITSADRAWLHSHLADLWRELDTMKAMIRRAERALELGR